MPPFGRNMLLEHGHFNGWSTSHQGGDITHPTALSPTYEPPSTGVREKRRRSTHVSSLNRLKREPLNTDSQASGRLVGRSKRMSLPCDSYSFGGGADGGQPSHFFTRYFLLDTLFGGRCLAPAPSPRALVRDSRLGGPSGRFLSLCEAKECQPIKVLETDMFISPHYYGGI